jgi:hypothetical protein
MRKLLMRVIVPLVVATGAALAASAPAHAGTTRLPYKSPAELASFCNQIGGWFDDLGHGVSTCILPDGRHMICMQSTDSCVWVYIWAPPKYDWRNPTWLDDVVLQPSTSPPTPPRPRYQLVANLAAAVNG